MTVDNNVFMGVARSLLLSADGVNFEPAVTNPIVKNVTVTREQLSDGAFCAVLLVATCGTLLFSSVGLVLYNRNSVTSSNGLEMRIL